MQHLYRQADVIDTDYEIATVLIKNVENAAEIIDKLRQGDIPATVLSTKLVSISIFVLK